MWLTMRSGLSRATSRGLGLQRRTPRVLQSRSISVLHDGHDLHVRLSFTGMHSDCSVGASRPEAIERRESIRRLHTPSSVTEDEPPGILSLRSLPIDIETYLTRHRDPRYTGSSSSHLHLLSSPTPIHPPNQQPRERLASPASGFLVSGSINSSSSSFLSSLSRYPASLSPSSP